MDKLEKSRQALVTIQRFLDECSKSGPGSRMEGRFQLFYSLLGAEIRATGLWNSEETEQLVNDVETFVFAKMDAPAIQWVSESEAKLARKVESGLYRLQTKSQVAEVDSAAIKYLLKIDQQCSPRDKLHMVSLFCRQLSKDNPDTETLLSRAASAVLYANPSNLVVNLRFCRAFRNKSLLKGSDEYCLSTLVGY